MARLPVAVAVLGATWTCWPAGQAVIAWLPSSSSSESTRRSGCRAATRAGLRGAPSSIPRAAYSEMLPIDKQYPKEALHSDLFDPLGVEEWLRPEVRQTLTNWRKSKDPCDIALEDLPGIRVEAPGVVSFDLLKEEVCVRILEEVKHYADSDYPSAAPNSMNRFGAILNDIGMRPCFTQLLRRHLTGIAARLFGEDAHRADTLAGEPLGTDNWGGSSLSDHHTFVVRYSADTDAGLDMHVDECDVTWNVGLTPGDAFTGGDLAFCGMFGEADYRQKHLSYRPTDASLGRCVVHSGKRRHCVTTIEAGERAGLIMWTKSILWRMTKEYKEKCDYLNKGLKPWPEESGRPDLLCLSKAHDEDYSMWSRRR